MSPDETLMAPPGSAPGAPQAVAAGRGLDWLAQGWRLFLRNPGIWVALAFIWLAIVVVMGMVPVINFFGFYLLTPVFLAGLLLGCRELADGGELRIDHLFAGFRGRAGDLVLLGMFYAAGMALAALAAFMVSGIGAAAGGLVGDAPGAGLLGGGILLAMAVYLLLATPLVMAFWFAPALVQFDGMRPWPAMQWSFAACWRNLVPFLVYGLVLSLLMVLATLPLGLGLLVLVPVAVGSLYAAYLDVTGRRDGRLG